MKQSMRDSTNPRESEPSARWSRLWSPRQWPKYLFTLACLGTLVMLLVTLGNRREARAEAHAQTPDRQVAPAPAAGQSDRPTTPELAVAERLVPPPVPDEQNFATTPYLAQIMDRTTIAKSQARWPEIFSRADQWPRRGPTLVESNEGRKTGRLTTDLAAWREAFALARDPSADNGAAGSSGEIAVVDFQNPATNAVAALAVLAALEPYASVLNELQAARSRPATRFNIRYDWENPWSILLPHLAYLKQTCQLLRLKASAELAAGHPAVALEDIRLMLRLVEAPKAEPTLISQLVRVACLEIAFQPIWEGLALRRWSEPELLELQTALQKFDLIADLEHCLQAERTWGNLSIALFRDKRSPVRFASLMSIDSKPEAWVEQADQAFVDAPRTWFDAEQKNFNRLFDQYLLTGFDTTAKRVVPSQIEENARQLERAVRSRDTILQDHLVYAKAFIIAPAKTHLKLAATQGYTDLAVVACALERHRLAVGQFPPSLDAVRPRFLKAIPYDLVSGQALSYERTGDGLFLLYSVGWNGTDDHGELAFHASGRGTERKQGDWVWRYPAPGEPTAAPLPAPR